MTNSKLITTGAVAVTTAIIGANAGLLGIASASRPNQKPATSARAAGRLALLRPLRRAVHGEAVIPVAGGQFATVTFDRGVVQSVAGNQLTLTEGTAKATYKTVTLAVPANAVVRDNRQPAQLSDVKTGQVAVVSRGRTTRWSLLTIAYCRIRADARRAGRWPRDAEGTRSRCRCGRVVASPS
jgi:hypothetical protein